MRIQTLLNADFESSGASYPNENIQRRLTVKNRLESPSHSSESTKLTQHETLHFSVEILHLTLVNCSRLKMSPEKSPILIHSPPPCTSHLSRPKISLAPVMLFPGLPWACMPAMEEQTINGSPKHGSLLVIDWIMRFAITISRRTRSGAAILYVYYCTSMQLNNRVSRNFLKL